jgi:hypothetical protein
MSRTSLTTTEVTTARKISVGLMVATATVVLISTIVAAIYTLTTRSAGSIGIPLTNVVDNSGAAPEPANPATDRSFITP